MFLFALLVDYVVYIIWPWSNRAGRRHRVSWITESWIILNGENYNSSFEGRWNITVQENTFALAKRDPGLQDLLSTTRKLLCLTLMHSNVIHLERIFTLCLNVGGGRLFNLMETENLFIFILRFGGDSFRQSFIWNTISREWPSTTVVMQQEIHGSLLNTSFEELGRKGRKSRR